MFLRETDSIGNHVAMEDAMGHSFTYLNLEDLGEHYRQIISERAVVFILCDYSIETVAFYYCMMNNHVVPLLLDKHLDKRMLGDLVRIYHPGFLWGHKVRTDFSQYGSVIEEAEEHILLATDYPSFPVCEELALLLTTSGSTGSQKLVRISYKNLISWCESAVQMFSLDEKDRAITTLPMNYCYGLSVMLMHWMAGASVSVTDLSILDVDFWEFLVKSKATNFAGVPFTYQMLERIHFLEKDYPGLRFLTQAGGKLLEERQMLFGREMQKKHIKFYVTYGQTEGVSMMTCLSCEQAADKLGSIGVPFPGMSVCVDGIQEGELIIHGENVSLGYASGWPDLAKGDENHGVLHTGDLAFFDEDAHLYLKGRKKRFIKLLGIRMSLDEAESVLGREFSTCEFACVGEDDSLKIYVAGEMDKETISEFCKDKLGVHRRMFRVLKCDSLPRNSSGKILYKELGKEQHE